MTYHDNLTQTLMGKTFSWKQAQLIDKEYQNAPTGYNKPQWRNIKTGGVVHFNHI